MKQSAYVAHREYSMWGEDDGCPLPQGMGEREGAARANQPLLSYRIYLPARFLQTGKTVAFARREGHCRSFQLIARILKTITFVRQSWEDGGAGDCCWFLNRSSTDAWNSVP